MSLTQKKMLNYLKRQKVDAQKRLSEAAQEIEELEEEIAGLIKRTNSPQQESRPQQEQAGKGIESLIPPVQKSNAPGTLEDVGRD
jgi:predicted  nucleic acid-binding Zn-ribbon protein